MTIVALLILAPRLGAVGAALAGLIGMSQALVFNGLVARRLGFDANAASWPFFIRLMVIAVPTIAVTFLLGAYVTGWLALIALGAASSAAFIAAWLMTFGRFNDRVVVETLIARIIGAPSRTP
jgi:O-antigen/teichoic acid export membrane protein